MKPILNLRLCCPRKRTGAWKNTLREFFRLPVLRITQPQISSIWRWAELQATPGKKFQLSWAWQFRCWVVFTNARSPSLCREFENIIAIVRSQGERESWSKLNTNRLLLAHHFDVESLPSSCRWARASDVIEQRVQCLDPAEPNIKTADGVPLLFAPEIDRPKYAIISVFFGLN